MFTHLYLWPNTLLWANNQYQKIEKQNNEKEHNHMCSPNPTSNIVLRILHHFLVN